MCAPQRRVAGAQNDDVVLRFHFEFGRECMLTSNMNANIKHFLVTLLKAAGVSDFIAREIVGHDSAAVSRQLLAFVDGAQAQCDAESAGRNGVEAQKRSRFPNAE